MSWIKTSIFLTFQVFIILALLEVLAVIYISYEPVSSRANYSDDVMSEIYGKANITDYRLVLKEQGMTQEYHPFVEYKESPRQGEFVTVSKENIRCNINGSSDCKILSGEKTVWVFGGSTVFGYGVKNSETIPSQLQKLLPGYTVVNFGHGSYYSTPERILFMEQLLQGKIPQVAIFFDGLNDYYYSKTPDESAFSSQMRYLMEESVGQLALRMGKGVLKKSALVKFMISKTGSDAVPDDVSLMNETAYKKELQNVASRLEGNFKARAALGDLYGIRVVNVLQPVPGFGVGHATSNVPESLLNLGDHKKSGDGYITLNRGKLGDAESNFLDLSNFGTSEPMYVDTVHYTPSFNQAIAQKIKQFVF